MADKPDTKITPASAQKDTADPIMASAIGKQLKRFYDDVAKEPVPDRFAKLLEQLAKQESDGTE